MNRNRNRKGEQMRSMMRAVGAVGLTMGCVWCAGLQAAEGQLGVRAVTLSTAGLALVEAEAEMAAEPLKVRLRRADVDDFLKSFWFSDPAGGVPTLRLAGAGGFDDTFALLPLMPGDVSDTARLLNARIGAPLVVQLGAESVRGINMGVARRACEGGECALLTLQTVEGGDGGDGAGGGEQVRSFVLDERLSVRFEEATDRQVLATALAAHRTLANPGVIELALSSDVPTARRVGLMYLQGAPVWKTAYRAMDTQDGLRLLGWAVVENTTGQDWEQVRLTLATGSVRALQAQLYEREQVARDTVVQASPRFKAEARSMEMLAPHAPAAMAAPAPMPARAAEVEADDGASFSRFTLVSPVSLRAGEMLSVPFLNEQLEDARLLIHRGGRGNRHPRLALEIHNPLPLRLPAGVLTLYEQGRGHAGDAMIPEMPPQSRRVVDFAEDRALAVREDTQQQERVLEMKVRAGVLTVTEELQRTTRYRIAGAEDAARTLHVEHPRQAGWNLQSPDPLRTELDVWRFGVDVAVAQETVFEVLERQPRSRRVALLDLDAQGLTLWLRTAPDEASRRVLERLAAIREEQAGLTRRLDRLAAQEQALIQEQSRLVEVVSALADAGAANTRRRARIDALDDEIGQARDEQGEVRDRLEALERSLHEVLKG